MLTLVQVGNVLISVHLDKAWAANQLIMVHRTIVLVFFRIYDIRVRITVESKLLFGLIVVYETIDFEGTEAHVVLSLVTIVSLLRAYYWLESALLTVL